MEKLLLGEKFKVIDSVSSNILNVVRVNDSDNQKRYAVIFIENGEVSQCEIFADEIVKSCIKDNTWKIVK